MGSERRYISLIFLIVFISLGLVFSSPVKSEELNINDVVALSPALSRHAFFNVTRDDNFEILAPELLPHPFGFLVEKGTGKVVMIQGMSYEDTRPLGWQPWFDQNEGEPTRSLIYGRMYTQQIYLSEPAAGFSRMPLENLSYESRVDFIFTKPATLNFFELKEINPKLELYEKMAPPVSADGKVVLFAPPGPGIVFVGEENGNILAMMATFPAKEGRPSWVQQENRFPIKHPVLGDIYSTTIYFQEPGDRYDLETWLQESSDPPPPEEGAFVFDGFVEPGFVFSDIALRDFFGSLNVTGKIRNDTDDDYPVAMFKIWLYDAEGKIIGDYEFTVIHGIRARAEANLTILVPIEPGVDLAEVTHYIRFQGPDL